MRWGFWINTACAAGISMSSIIAVPSITYAGEGFFEKIGDGWKKGKWIPGLPDVKPKTWQEVVFPICWGHPQDCRGMTEESAKKAGGDAHPPIFSRVFRVDCKDKDNGKPRGDSTITFTSKVSLDDAENEALKAYESSDLCQIDPNYKDPSRVMVPGSGKFVDV